MCEAPFQLSHLVDIEAQLSRELPKEDIFKRETIKVYPKVIWMPGKQMNCTLEKKLKMICGRLDRYKREDWVECWILNFWCIFQWFAVWHCFVFLDTFDNTQCVLHTQSFRIDNYEEEIMKSKNKLMVFWRKKVLGQFVWSVFRVEKTFQPLNGPLWLTKAQT